MLRCAIYLKGKNEQNKELVYFLWLVAIVTLEALVSIKAIKFRSQKAKISS